MGEPIKAIEDFSMAIELDPTDISLLSSRAAQLAAVGDFAAAIEDMNRVILAEPSCDVFFLKKHSIF